jgi:diaminohydroxyphosphoribosylaminopyrimidine deaminase / 5-amino-6-(5-phosphoribosylamino)uracil reductase
VVVAVKDPNPQVSGRGIERLRNAGIEVITDLLREEAILFNRPFITYHIQKRPWIVLKWAQTADGFIGRPGEGNVWISGQESRLLTHLWRTQLMAILVGRKTIEFDDPQLTARLVTGRQPVRMVMGIPKKREIPYRVMDNSAKTLVFPACIYSETAQIMPDQNELMEDMLKFAYREGIQSILVEGGSETINRFFKQGIWDEARVFLSPDRWGGGIAAPKLEMSPVYLESIGRDQLYVYRNAEIG